MGAGDLAHEQDHRHDHESRGGHSGDPADCTIKLSGHHPAAGSDEDEKESAEKLRGQSTPFLARILEVVDALEEGILDAQNRVGRCLIF